MNSKININLIINLNVESIKDAEMIAHDLHELLNSSGLTNTIKVDNLLNK